MLEYKIVEHMSYDWMIVAYFFLGGISAGSYIFSVIANYWRKEFKPLAKTAAILAPVSLGLGMLILLIDLGQPLRAAGLFLNFNPTSAISWGIWFLNIFLVLSLIYAWFLIRGEEEKIKKVACIGLPFSLIAGTYTGILLAQAPGRALWHSALTPILFLVGGLISGLALVMLVSMGIEDKALLKKLGKVIVGLLSLELGLILVEIIVLSNGGVRGVDIIKSLLIGELSLLFWVLEIILGAVLPMYIILRTKMGTSASALASLLVLMGIYTMRYIVVVGGQVPTF